MRSLLKEPKRAQTGAFYGCEISNLYLKDSAFIAVNQRNGRSLPLIKFC